MTTNLELAAADPPKQSILGSIESLWTEIWTWLPGVAGAFVVLVLGVMIGKLLGGLVARLLKRMGLDRLATRIGLEDDEGELSIKTPLSKLGGKFIFWAVMLTAIMSAASLLGLNRVSGVLDSIVLFLPRIFAAIAILLAGMLLAVVLRRTVRKASKDAGLNYSRAAGLTVYWFIVAITLLVSVTQLEIETRLLGRLVIVVVASFGLLIALALGLGLRGLAGQVISGLYARDIFTEGMRIKVEDQSATVEQVGTTTTRVRKDDGTLRFVPNRYLIEEIIDQDTPQAAKDSPDTSER